MKIEVILFQPYIELITFVAFGQVFLKEVMLQLIRAHRVCNEGNVYHCYGKGHKFAHQADVELPKEALGHSYAA